MSIEFQHFRNQYLISEKKNTLPDLQFESDRLNDLHLFRSPALDYTYSESNSVSVSILGFILDPLSPALSNKEIARKLAESCPNSLSLFKEMHQLSGRYVIIYKNDDEHIVLGDAGNLRQIYYHFGELGCALTSSPKLFLSYFDLQTQTAPLKKNFIERADLERHEWAWFGNKSVDDRLLKLLPNQYLDLNNQKVQRIPYYEFEQINTPKEHILPICIQLLEGTYEALVHRNFSLMQPLTAGLDSRLLLAASRKHQNHITYYVFDRSKINETNQDVEIPKKISRKTGIDFQVFTPSDIEENFIEKYSQNHLQPRLLPKTRNIQYFFRLPDNDGNLLNINGNFAGITKCFYGNGGANASANMLRYFTGYPDDPFIENEIESWFLAAKEYANKINVPLLDLFYWEQRVGNWGARISEESDMALEEFSPLCNRKLIFTIFAAGYNERKKPNFRIYKALIKEIWPALLSEPINPDEPKLPSLVKRNAYSRYFAAVIMHQLKKLKG